jgi:hypothetical protein
MNKARTTSNGLRWPKSLSIYLMTKSLEEDVRGAFDRANEGTGSPDELLSAVRVLVRDLKQAGQPPEQVIVAVKQVCGLPLITFAADTDAAADGSPSKQISDMMVRAAIDEYYMKPRTKADGAASNGRKRK